VDNTIGVGQPKALFYDQAGPRNAYKNYVRVLVQKRPCHSRCTPIVMVSQGLCLAFVHHLCVPRHAVQVAKLVNRKNTVNGRIYKNDPTIMSLELCNECQ
jgi:hypothetical protein